MARKYSVQNYMRRTADDLSISGAAVIVLGAWSFLKLFVTAVLEGALITPEDVKVFFDIYIRQSNPKRPADEPKKEEREENPAS